MDPDARDADEGRAARAFVVNSLAARAQSVGEIEAKLTGRGVSPGVAEAVVAEALRGGYLDDAELAGQLARGLRARGYGRRRAAQALERRKLKHQEADAALDAAYGGTDEAALARAALGRRRIGDVAEQRRAVGFLVRRGFGSAVAWQVVRGRSGERG